jgi:hypothetical protein
MSIPTCAFRYVILIEARLQLAFFAPTFAPQDRRDPSFLPSRYAAAASALDIVL